MLEYYENDYERVFNYMLRMKRWMRDMTKEGIFYKDVVYLNGYVDVQNYLDTGWDLKKLYLGKLRSSDLQTVVDSGLVDINTENLKVPFFS